jgi:hypothetical protein
VKLTKSRRRRIYRKKEVDGKKKRKKRVSRKIAGRDCGQSKSKPDSQTFKGRQK